MANARAKARTARAKAKANNLQIMPLQMILTLLDYLARSAQQATDAFTARPENSCAASCVDSTSTSTWWDLYRLTRR